MDIQYAGARFDRPSRVEVRLQSRVQSRPAFGERTHQRLAQRGHRRLVSVQRPLGQKFETVHRPGSVRPADDGFFVTGMIFLARFIALLKGLSHRVSAVDPWDEEP